MKKLWMFLSLIGLACTGMAQNVPSYVPTNGLVGWWPFNGNANDESGNGNNGTVNGASLTSDRFGNANRAFTFNGIDNHISTIYPGVLGNANRSVSFWAKHIEVFNSSQCASCSRKPILSYGSNVQGPSQIGNGFFCEFNVGLTGISFDGNETAAAYSTPNPVNDNNWHFYTYVFRDVSNVVSVKIYQDGILLNQPAYTYLPDFSLNTLLGASLEFGRRTFNQSPPSYYKGSLDDIGFWNRALTQQEITNLYNASTSDPAPCPTLPVNLQNGLVGYWPFCGNANDESGNGNNGTVNGATLTSDRFGNSNRAYSFDGVNDYVEILNNPTLSVQNWSISAWINVSGFYTSIVNGNVSEGNIIVGKGTDFNDGFYALSYLSLNKKARTSIGIGTLPNFVDNTTEIITGQWIQLTGTWDGSFLRIYYNGRLEKSNPISISQGINSENLFFGTMAANSIYPYWVNGKLDDICIWNRALDSTEITQLYQTQSSNSSQGNVGINVIAPQRNLHVKDVIRLEPRSTPPDNPVFGDMYIDAVLKKLRVYDGTTWQNCW